MVTGDNVETARSIAEKCGIIPKGNKNFLVVEGPAFRKKVMTVNEEGEEMVSCCACVCVRACVCVCMSCACVCVCVCVCVCLYTLNGHDYLTYFIVDFG